MERMNMVSIRARMINFTLPLLGIKKLFAEVDKLEGKLVEMRKKPSPKPGKKWQARYDIIEDNARGFETLTFLPKSGLENGAPHLLYLHGGGYVMDIAPQHYDLIGKLCDSLGASATVPLYPLAPEHKATHILATMREVYGELASEYGAKNITVMGDSAGGGMSLALAQMLAKEGAEQPAQLVLYSPWLDATASGEGQAEIEPRDAMLTMGGIKKCGELYRGELAMDDPKVSPLFGDFDGLPPMMIFAGTRDILVADARRLVQRLDGQGSKSHIYHEYPEMIHVWMVFPTPEAHQAIAQTSAFIEGNSPAKDLAA
jgi:acetyl esterase/lipase